MKLSAPIYHLKRIARQIARNEGIDLNVALDRIAVTQGFNNWSLLAARYAARSPAARLYASLKHGDMMLIGARPGQGKTLLALEIAAEATKHGNHAIFFTLEYTESEVRDRIAHIDTGARQFGGAFQIDCSDDICAEYIMARARSAAPGTVLAIDYLQLLDQRRTQPPLAKQIAALKTFAQSKGLVVVFISQIARTYDPATKPEPDLTDIRLPNPVDLAMFTKTHFIGNQPVHSNIAG